MAKNNLTQTPPNGKPDKAQAFEAAFVTPPTKHKTPGEIRYRIRFLRATFGTRGERGLDSTGVRWYSGIH